MLYRKYQLIFLFILVGLTAYSIPYSFTDRISWSSIQRFEIEDGFFVERISFKGAYYSDIQSLPKYIKEFPIHTESAKLKVYLLNTTFIPATAAETELLLKIKKPDTTISIQESIVISRKEPFARVEIVPIKWNNKKQIFEKLVSFETVIEVEDIPMRDFTETTYASNSVLASGNWYKIRVDKSGMYKITFEELKNMGFNMSVNPRNIAIFGNGGGILPEKNNDFRYDDLTENPIVIVGEEDGSFDEGDYILFYGESPVVWKYNPFTGHFFHQNNYYDDYSYYFITKLGAQAKRIQEAVAPTGSFNVEVNEFDDYAFHEIDDINIAGSGRVWYGETFDFSNTHEVTFSFPNIITLSNTAHYKSSFAVRAFSSSAFKIHINDVLLKTLNISAMSTGNRYQIAKMVSTDFSFTPKNDQLTVKLIYQRTSNSSIGYLDYIDLNVRRKLTMSGNQMGFRKKVATENDEVVRYTLSNADAGITIWDITFPLNPEKIKTQSGFRGSLAEFFKFQ